MALAGRLAGAPVERRELADNDGRRDFVGWIELFAATLVVTRLAPGWRSFKARVARVVQARILARPRVSRMRRTRRPPPVPDDPDLAWVFA